ncbi:hypothetical protein DSECCO2_475990 [anaerobic digester metagenome]
MLFEVFAVGHIQEHLPPGFEYAPELGEDPQVFLDGVEVAEAVPEDEDDVVGVGPIRQPACIPLPEPDLQPLPLRGRPGSLDQVMRLVEAFGVVAPACEFEGMPALAAAEVEDLLVGAEAQNPGDPVDLPPGDSLVVDDVAIGLQVEVIEDTPPPIGFYVLFKVRDRTDRPFIPGSPLPPAIRGFVRVDLVGHAEPLILVLSPEQIRHFIRLQKRLIACTIAG